MATTVVPWVISGRATSRGRSPQRGSPPARRNTSMNDGPGSSSARKVGRVIAAEATGSLTLPRRTVGIEPLTSADSEDLGHAGPSAVRCAPDQVVRVGPGGAVRVVGDHRDRGVGEQLDVVGPVADRQDGARI